MKPSLYAAAFYSKGSWGTARVLSTASWGGRWGGSPLDTRALDGRLDPDRVGTCGVSCLIVVVDG